MPELVMERPKMSLQMHETLKRYILRERRKKKEQDVANEQKIQEEIKKAELNTQTLENTKEQVKQLEIKLEELQVKKRDLFNQLKKVLNEETNLKKNSRMQQMAAVAANQTPPPPSILYPSPTISQSNSQIQQLHPQNQHLLNPISMFNQLGSGNHLTSMIPPSPTSSTTSSGPIQSPLQTSSQNLIGSGLTPKSNPSSFSHLNLVENNNGPSAISNKPQSPFHPPQLPPTPHPLSSPSPNFSLLSSAAALKYLAGQNPLLSPSHGNNPNNSNRDSINNNNNNPNKNDKPHHLLTSPSSSPHLSFSSPSPRHHISNNLNTPNVKRQRSPSPLPPHHSSSSIPNPSLLPTGHSIHHSSSHLANQILFNQTQLLQHQQQQQQQQNSRSSSAHMIPSSPPPNKQQQQQQQQQQQMVSQQQFNSPINSNKKVKPSISNGTGINANSNNNGNQANTNLNRSSSKSPHQPRNLNEALLHQQMQQQQQQQQQQLSAFSSYFNRAGGPNNSFPPPLPPMPPSKHLNSSMASSSRSINSNLQLPVPSPQNIPPHQLASFNQNLLNAFGPEQAQKLIQQQNPHNLHQLQLMSALASGGHGALPPGHPLHAINGLEAQMNHLFHPSLAGLPPFNNNNNNNNNNGNNSQSSGGGGGSILTGFSVRKSGSSSNLQHPPF